MLFNPVCFHFTAGHAVRLAYTGFHWAGAGRAGRQPTGRRRDQAGRLPRHSSARYFIFTPLLNFAWPRQPLDRSLAQRQRRLSPFRAPARRHHYRRAAALNRFAARPPGYGLMPGLRCPGWPLTIFNAGVSPGYSLPQLFHLFAAHQHAGTSSGPLRQAPFYSAGRPPAMVIRSISSSSLPLASAPGTIPFAFRTGPGLRRATFIHY